MRPCHREFVEWNVDLSNDGTLGMYSKLRHHCLSRPCHCLSSTFHCLVTAFHRPFTTSDGRQRMETERRRDRPAAFGGGVPGSPRPICQRGVLLNGKTVDCGTHPTFTAHTATAFLRPSAAFPQLFQQPFTGLSSAFPRPSTPFSWPFIACKAQAFVRCCCCRRRRRHCRLVSSTCRLVTPILSNPCGRFRPVHLNHLSQLGLLRSLSRTNLF